MNYGISRSDWKSWRWVSLDVIFTMRDYASVPKWIHSHNSLAAVEASILNILLHGTSPTWSCRWPHTTQRYAMQKLLALCNDYYNTCKIYEAHQMLIAFILLCMIFIISLFQLCLVFVGKSWGRQISDRYLFLILDFWRELLNIKMKPERKSICHKI